MRNERISGGRGNPVPATPEARRLLTMQLAERMGNVAEACRRTGMDRSDYYMWKRRFADSGIDGLRDIPRSHRTHPQKTSAQLEGLILDIALGRPDWGCAGVAEELSRFGHSLSSPTVQLVLSKHGLGSEEERSWRSEEAVWADPEKLTPQLRRAIERNNPCFRELGMKPSAPGELLIQDTCLVTRLKEYGRVNLLVTVDAYCSYAFAEPDTSKYSSSPLLTMIEEILPLYERYGFSVQTVVTDAGREFAAGMNHDYGSTLAELGVEHRRRSVRSLHDNGHLARFRRAIAKEFIGGALAGRRDVPWLEFSEALREWLHEYNHRRSHRGYPNMGKSPIAIMEEQSRPKGQEGSHNATERHK